MRSCFLFGHRNCPDRILPELERMIEQHYLVYGVRCFYVGSRGNFDRLATIALENAKRKHQDLQRILLLAYHPAERKPDDEYFDKTFYPPLESVPRPYTIVRANHYMVETTDTVICYVAHFGNTRDLLEFAQQKQKSKQIIVDNLAEV